MQNTKKNAEKAFLAPWVFRENAPFQMKKVHDTGCCCIWCEGMNELRRGCNGAATKIDVVLQRLHNSRINHRKTTEWFPSQITQTGPQIKLPPFQDPSHTHLGISTFSALAWISMDTDVLFFGEWLILWTSPNGYKSRYGYIFD